MTAQIIAVAKMKGGVGKTATVVSIAETLAANAVDRNTKRRTSTKPVLVVDLDAQASASFAFAGDELLTKLISSGKTIDGFFEQYFQRNLEPNLTDFITQQVATVTHSGDPLAISLLASSPDLRTLERGLVHGLTQQGYSLAKIEAAMFDLLSSNLSAVSSKYDYIIFDCPPGISILTEVAIRMADLTIVPTIPDFLSVLGLDAFQQNVWSSLAETNAESGSSMRPPYVLITKRKNLIVHNQKVSELRKRSEARLVPYNIFKIEIPESQDVAKAVELIDSYPTYGEKWGTVRVHLAALAQEIEAALKRRQ